MPIFLLGFFFYFLAPAVAAQPSASCTPMGGTAVQWIALPKGPPGLLTLDDHRSTLGPSGIPMYLGVYPFDARAGFHTGGLGDAASDRLFRIIADYQHYSEVVKGLFGVGWGVQSLVPETVSSYQARVSVASAVARLLAGGSAGPGLSDSRVLEVAISAARSLPARLAALGLPDESVATAKLAAVIEGPASKGDADTVRAAATKWLGEPRPSSLTELESAGAGIVYLEIADGPISGAGTSWSLTWQMRVDQLDREDREGLYRTMQVDRLVENMDVTGLYSQLLVGTSAIRDLRMLFLIAARNGVAQRGIAATLVEPTFLSGVELSGYQWRRLRDLYGNFDRASHALSL